MICRDGCLRDLSSVHGTYRSVDETEDAIQMVGKFLAVKKPNSVKWLLDRPISNSGRLAHKITDIAMKNKWPWSAELVNCPDYVLHSAKETVITSDSAVLDKAAKWVNLGACLVKSYIPDAWMIDLRQA